LVEIRAYRPARNIFDRPRTWPKERGRIRLSEGPVFLGIPGGPFCLAADDPFRPGNKRNDG
jgi:hypothetical protein